MKYKIPIIAAIAICVAFSILAIDQMIRDQKQQEFSEEWMKNRVQIMSKLANQTSDTLEIKGQQ